MRTLRITLKPWAVFVSSCLVVGCTTTQGVVVPAVIGSDAGCGPTMREIIVINNCPATVWVGALGNTSSMCQSNADCGLNQFCTPIVNHTSTTCGSGGSCPPGQTCDTSTNTCQFRLCTFVPVHGDQNLGPGCNSNGDCSSDMYCDTGYPTQGFSGTCESVAADGNGWSMAEGDNENFCVPTPWAGRFWPRTGCAQNGGAFTCDTGQCVGLDGTTPALSCGQSAEPPATLAELNMQAWDGATNDFYDVSMVDGGNLGVSLVPLPSTYDIKTTGAISQTSCSDDTLCVTSLGANFRCDTNLGVCVNAFECGSPGCGAPPCSASGIDPTVLPSCGWDGAGQLAVAQDACGLPLLNSTGTYVGCLTPAIACARNVGQLPCDSPPELPCTPGSCPFGMTCDTDTFTCQGADNTNDDLYGCTGANSGSCFSELSCTQDSDCTAQLPPQFTCQNNQCVDPQCCGCPSWIPEGYTCPAGDNPEWHFAAEPFLIPFNTACPTAYSFAYDDILKLFTCLGESATNNLGYTITLCPTTS